MGLIVQKFGGTSVADSEKILAAARRAVRSQQQGNQVVMVVSAMGKNTDMLLELAQEVNSRPPAREMDMLLSTGEQVSVALMAMAVEALGSRAVSLTGAQIGIRTDSIHTKARIKSISTERMQKLLAGGHIVIAAGFQGIDEDYNITTLGRGGSDTTAVALAAVLGATTCEIYTDVDGIYTTDPRVVPEARRLNLVSFDEMLELASLGAGVMHSRSIEFAKKYDVPIHVRSSLTDAPGTLIGPEPENSDKAVTGVAVDKNEARVAILGVPDVPGTSHEIFSRLADRNISVDMIVQNVGEEGKADISFTVPSSELASTLETMVASADVLEAENVIHDADVAKISAVGAGMIKQTGVATKMFQALGEADVNMKAITTSEIKISVLVDRIDAAKALREVHAAFDLAPDPQVKSQVMPVAAGPAFAAARSAADALEVVKRLQGIDMEELMIEGVSLDDTQARVTLRGVPDQPGVAAKVFGGVADAGVLVDMIVQSIGSEGLNNISFTIPRRDLTKSVSVAQSLVEQFGGGTVSSSPVVAKLKVTGVGLRSHSAFGPRMFKALADAEINVEMINTSEVQISVVVDGLSGEQALSVLKKEFADAVR